MIRNSLIGKDLSELEEYCISYNFPKFHGNQLYKWMYNKYIFDMDLMTNIPKDLKKEINKEFIFSTLKINDRKISKLDNTIKYLFETNDNNSLEQSILKKIKQN